MWTRPVAVLLPAERTERGRRIAEGERVYHAVAVLYDKLCWLRLGQLALAAQDGLITADEWSMALEYMGERKQW